VNTDPQFEIVELGDAKQMTGGPRGLAVEANPVLPFRPV
jgi:hypothetical protein